MAHGNAEFVAAVAGFHPGLTTLDVNFGVADRTFEMQDLIAVQGIDELAALGIDLQAGRATALGVKKPGKKNGNADGQGQNQGIQETEANGQDGYKVSQADKKAKAGRCCPRLCCNVATFIASGKKSGSWFFQALAEFAGAEPFYLDELTIEGGFTTITGLDRQLQQRRIAFVDHLLTDPLDP